MTPEDKDALKALGTHDGDTPLARWFHAYKVDNKAEYASRRDILEVQEIRKDLPRGRELVEYSARIYSEWPDAPMGRVVMMSPGTPAPPSFLRPAIEPYEPPRRREEAMPGLGGMVSGTVAARPSYTSDQWQKDLAKMMSEAMGIPRHLLQQRPLTGALGAWSRAYDERARRHVQAAARLRRVNVEGEQETAPEDVEIGEKFRIKASTFDAKAEFEMREITDYSRRTRTFELALAVRPEGYGPEMGVIVSSYLTQDPEDLPHWRAMLRDEKRTLVCRAVVALRSKIPQRSYTIGRGAVFYNDEKVGDIEGLSIDFDAERKDAIARQMQAQLSREEERILLRASETFGPALAGTRATTILVDEPGPPSEAPSWFRDALAGPPGPPPASSPPAKPPTPEPPAEPPPKIRNY